MGRNEYESDGTSGGDQPSDSSDDGVDAKEASFRAKLGDSIAELCFNFIERDYAARGREALQEYGNSVDFESRECTESQFRVWAEAEQGIRLWTPELAEKMNSETPQLTETAKYGLLASPDMGSLMRYPEMCLAKYEPPSVVPFTLTNAPSTSSDVLEAPIMSVKDLISSSVYDQFVLEAFGSKDKDPLITDLADTDKSNSEKAAKYKTRKDHALEGAHTLEHYSEVHTLELLDGDYEVRLQSLLGIGGLSFVLQQERKEQVNFAYLLDPMLVDWCAMYTRAVKYFGSPSSSVTRGSDSMPASLDRWWLWGYKYPRLLGLDVLPSDGMDVSSEKDSRGVPFFDEAAQAGIDQKAIEEALAEQAAAAAAAAAESSTSTTTTSSSSSTGSSGSSTSGDSSSGSSSSSSGSSDDSSDCVDNDIHCSDWASGDPKWNCNGNPEYMMVYCKKSCRVCTVQSSDGGGDSPDPLPPSGRRHRRVLAGGGGASDDSTSSTNVESGPFSSSSSGDISDNANVESASSSSSGSSRSGSASSSSGSSSGVSSNNETAATKTTAVIKCTNSSVTQQVNGTNVTKLIETCVKTAQKQAFDVSDTPGFFQRMFKKVYASTERDLYENLFRTGSAHPINGGLEVGNSNLMMCPLNAFLLGAKYYLPYRRTGSFVLSTKADWPNDDAVFRKFWEFHLNMTTGQELIDRQEEAASDSESAGINTSSTGCVTRKPALYPNKNASDSASQKVFRELSSDDFAREFKRLFGREWFRKMNNGPPTLLNVTSVKLDLCQDFDCDPSRGTWNTETKICTCKSGWNIGRGSCNVSETTGEEVAPPAESRIRYGIETDRSQTQVGQGGLVGRTEGGSGDHGLVDAKVEVTPCCLINDNGSPGARYLSGGDEYAIGCPGQDASHHLHLGGGKCDDDGTEANSLTSPNQKTCSGQGLCKNGACQCFRDPGIVGMRGRACGAGLVMNCHCECISENQMDTMVLSCTDYVEDTTYHESVCQGGDGIAKPVPLPATLSKLKKTLWTEVIQVAAATSLTLPKTLVCSNKRNDLRLKNKRNALCAGSFPGQDGQDIQNTDGTESGRYGFQMAALSGVVSKNGQGMAAADGSAGLTNTNTADGAGGGYGSAVDNSNTGDGAGGDDSSADNMNTGDGDGSAVTNTNTGPGGDGSAGGGECAGKTEGEACDLPDNSVGECARAPEAGKPNVCLPMGHAGTTSDGGGISSNTAAGDNMDVSTGGAVPSAGGRRLGSRTHDRSLEACTRDKPCQDPNGNTGTCTHDTVTQVWQCMPTAGSSSDGNSGADSDGSSSGTTGLPKATCAGGRGVSQLHEGGGPCNQNTDCGGNGICILWKSPLWSAAEKALIQTAATATVPAGSTQFAGLCACRHSIHLAKPQFSRIRQQQSQAVCGQHDDGTDLYMNCHCQCVKSTDTSNRLCSVKGAEKAFPPSATWSDGFGFFCNYDAATSAPTGNLEYDPDMFEYFIHNTMNGQKDKICEAENTELDTRRPNGLDGRFYDREGVERDACASGNPQSQASASSSTSSTDASNNDDDGNDDGAGDLTGILGFSTQKSTSKLCNRSGSELSFTTNIDLAFTVDSFPGDPDPRPPTFRDPADQEYKLTTSSERPPRFLGRANTILAGILITLDNNEIEECATVKSTLVGELLPSVVERFVPYLFTSVVVENEIARTFIALLTLSLFSLQWGRGGGGGGGAPGAAGGREPLHVKPLLNGRGNSPTRLTGRLRKPRRSPKPGGARGEI
jgi:hypothetical protein